MDVFYCLKVPVYILLGIKTVNQSLNQPFTQTRSHPVMSSLPMSQEVSQPVCQLEAVSDSQPMNQAVIQSFFILSQ